jgi:hypothetical protein
MAEHLRLQLDRYKGPIEPTPEIWAALMADGTALIGKDDEPLPESDVRFVLAIARHANLVSLSRPGLLACTVEFAWTGGWLLRVDHIALTAGSITPRHRHRGPGIRLMGRGAVDAMVGDQRFLVHAGQAWLERLNDDIVGRADPTLGAAFHRFVILPPALAGGHTSYIACEPEPCDPTNAPFEREQVVLAEEVFQSI